MNWHLQIPSKTFIIGEYAVLEGAPCLGAATTPYFEMIFSSPGKKQDVTSGFHPESPAGKFFLEHQDIFVSTGIQFIDPLKGLGGFGASTAQYLGLWAFREMILKKRTRAELIQAGSVKEMIREYRNYSSRKQGRAPSGADMAIQLCGGLCWIDATTWEMQRLNWPWAQVIGFFISTGNKVPTHSHLQDLSDFNPSELFRILQQTRSDLRAKEAVAWLESVDQYSQALDMLGLVAPETKKLLLRLRELNGVRAAKGCGAMGADVIFCVVDSQNQSSFLGELSKTNLRVIATTKDFSPGLKIFSEETLQKRDLSHD